MSVHKNAWEIALELRGHIPSSRIDTIIRKLAFLYFLNKKFDSGIDRKDVHETANGVSSALLQLYVLSPGHELPGVGQGQDFPFKNLDALLGAVMKCWDDYSSTLNGGEGPNADTPAIHDYYYPLSEQELLGILNTPLFGSAQEEATPEDIDELVFELAQPYLKSYNRVTDMACGNGTFLLRAYQHFSAVHGVEINQDNAEIATLRLFANQIRGEIRNLDCFYDSWKHQGSLNEDSQECSDLVFSEFPWKIIVKDARQKEAMLNCNANRFPMSPNSTTEYFFLSATMNYLNENGVAISVVPLSLLSNLVDRPIREHIVKRGYLREVILLPKNVFWSTSIATAIVVMGIKPVEKVCFFDASSYAFQQRQRTVRIDILSLLNDLNEAKANGSCYYSKEDIANRDYSFSPLRYQNVVETLIPNPVKLGSVAEIFTGWQASSAKLKDLHVSEGGVSLLQMSNIECGIIDTELDTYQIPKATIARFVLQEGDVVISAKSLTVKSAVVENVSDNQPIIAAGSLMVIRPKKRLLDPYYLASFFESDLGRQILTMYQTGNVIPNLSIGNVREIPIPKLSLKLQKEIGVKYKDLRDLIAFERERLKSLERRVSGLLDHLWDLEEGR